MKKKKSFWQSILDFLGDSSPFMTLVGKAAMLVVLNVCCLLCCLPVVTAGAAVTALYAVLLEREEHSYLSAPAAFFRQLRRRFRQATVLWLPFLILALLLGMEAWVLLVRQLTDHALLLTPLLVAAALWAMTLLWLFPLLARGTAAPLCTAFVLALRELWRSLAVMALSSVPFILFLFWPRTFLELLPFWTLLGFSLTARCSLLLLEPVLRKMP